MRILLYSCKGGVGKSVISAATALKLAERGYRTLRISGEPAYDLSALLETDVQPLRFGPYPSRHSHSSRHLSAG